MIVADNTDSTEEWVSLSEAAKELDTSDSKLSRWAKQKRIKSKKNPYDLRQVLVDMNELRTILKPRKTEE